MENCFVYFTTIKNELIKKNLKHMQLVGTIILNRNFFIYNYISILWFFLSKQTKKNHRTKSLSIYSHFFGLDSLTNTLDHFSLNMC